MIIEEPEARLHPKWQVEYAKILVQLVKKGVKVLVTSHSPDFIEAISKFSEEIKEKTKFYLSELTEEGNAVITDKTGDKESIFSPLSKPFKELIFD